MNIGDITVVAEGTTNPYTAASICGKERADLLGRFLKGQETPGYEFWFAPACGGARRLSCAEEARVDPFTIEYYWGSDGIYRVRHR